MIYEEQAKGRIRSATNSFWDEHKAERIVAPMNCYNSYRYFSIKKERVFP